MVKENNKINDVTQNNSVVENLAETILSAKGYVTKEYSESFSELRVKDPEKCNLVEDLKLYKIDKCTFVKEENHLDKLQNVYSSLIGLEGSVVNILKSNGNKVEVYIGVKKSGKWSSSQLEQVLYSSLIANFPGSILSKINKNDKDNLFYFKDDDSNRKEINQDVRDKVVSSVTTIPSLKIKDEKDSSGKYFVQGIERFIDSMRRKTYTCMIIAEPVHKVQLQQMKLSYESLYSQLSPFVETNVTTLEGETESIMNGISTGISSTVTNSIANSHTNTQGNSNQRTKGTSNSVSKNGMVQGLLYGASAGAAIGSIIPGLGTVAVATIGAGVGFVGGILTGDRTTGTNESVGQATNNSTTNGETNTSGTSKGHSKTESKQESIATTSSKSIQLKYTNMTVKKLMEQIEEHLKRIESSESYGIWNSAAYFIADDLQTSRLAANTFSSLVKGEKSFVETTAVNSWDIDNNNRQNILKHLSNFNHPELVLGLDINNNEMLTSPGAYVSGKELPILMGLPQKSVNGFPVVEGIEFGRNVKYMNNNAETKTIKLGHMYHLGNIEDNEVNLNLNSLASHTFISGSTGSGKSNTVYNLLSEITKKGKKFMVIEPTKGEYKNIFGGRDDVEVYGTNPKYTKMLKINPFKFPEDIHVLEHIDKLIEIFNACWPMYAAMPAILKEAVEEAYKMLGWDLDSSVNYLDKSIYPTFKDLLATLRIVIDNTDYADEQTSNYKGALLTRVKSLTNGLIGRIFCSKEIDNKELFDGNSIIDISRVGSSDTKSLIMGILFMRLQEHRAAGTQGSNTDLKHITVIEEAHHLLRRTSVDQSQEGENLKGKAVEMISNSIAEMRTYGEGFILVDQAPELMDQSAIRNTNTKIVLRLPELNDKEIVGKSVNLNEDQINEISRFETGVAVVYQNNWLEAVLCKIDVFDSSNEKKYQHEAVNTTNKSIKSDILNVLLSHRVSLESKVDLVTIDMLEIEEWIQSSNINIKDQTLLLSLLWSEGNHKLFETDNFPAFSELIKRLFGESISFLSAYYELGVDDWNNNILKQINYYYDMQNEELTKSFLQCLMRSRVSDDDKFIDLYQEWIEMTTKGATNGNRIS